MLSKHLLESSRGRIVTLLQRGPLTADEIATQLGVTGNAIRMQLTAMERDGLVRRAGRRTGATRPSNVFELTSDLEEMLSGAYLPLLAGLVAALSRELPSDRVDQLMRSVGRDLANELAPGRLRGDLQDRVTTVSTMLNEHLGALTRVESNGRFVIRGEGCPLASLTRKHPATCLALESLIEELVGAPVHENCERGGDRPRCRFEIEKAAGP